MKDCSYLIPALLATLLGAGCAAHYHYIEPANVRFEETAATLAGDQIEVAYRYDVLREAGNRRYARKERQSGIALLALRIQNHGPDTLFLPDDFLVTTGPETLYLLPLEEAAETLSQTTAEEAGSGAVEVEVPSGLAVTRDIFNAFTQVKANIRLAKEMEEHYLLPGALPPGCTVTGLLALPVASGAPLKFSVKK